MGVTAVNLVEALSCCESVGCVSLWDGAEGLGGHMQVSPN